MWISEWRADVGDVEIEEKLPLTPVVFHTLLALATGPRHGYAIAREVERVTEGKVRMGPGTLYGSLRRLEADGLIREVDGPTESEGGHAERRRYYGLTATGRAVAVAEERRLRGVVALARTALGGEPGHG